MPHTSRLILFPASQPQIFLLTSKQTPWCVPLTRCLVSNLGPWFNDDIKIARRERRKAERKWRRTGHTDDMKNYKITKNNTNKLMNEARRQFYKNFIKANNSNQHKSFAAAKKLLNHGDKRVAFPLSVDKVEFANQIKWVLISLKKSIIFTLILKMGHDLPEFEVYNISETTAHLSNFNTLTEEDVRTLIKECGEKNSAVDPMPTSLVIDRLDVLLPTITKIINLSLDSGTFADIWKCALVHPLLKTVGVDPLFVNCRPITKLQYISKLTDKVVFSQTHSHMTAHSLYPELQSSYRRYHSTETALLKVTNDILL